MIVVRTQAEFDAAIAAGGREITIDGDVTIVVTSADELLLQVVGSSQPRVVARDSSQPRVVARDSSQPRVEAWGSSQPRVEARESSQPRVEAWGSSQPRVVARDSSQPRVEARGYVQLSVSGRTTVTAGPQCSVLIEGAAPQVEGGQQTRLERSTAAEWCAFYGLPIVDGVVTLYKAVRHDFASNHDPAFFWRPGTLPSVPRMDAHECGVGLHFCPSPGHARAFYNAEDARYIACPVRVDDIRVHPNPDYPTKVKAPRVCAPVFEVTEDGEPIPAPAVAAVEGASA
ncbi:MAG TPA: hypothetical protein VEC57_14955 [Candidatus Limnocylindrales bacterium]|nr:hypothetical protein [Candidatus Limnocylindrales bacterium]